MLRFATITALLLLTSFSERAQAFSLAGPQPPWMLEAAPSAAACYSLPLLLNYSGPMGLDEEYRFNSPVVTYGFTSDFVSFFGKRGMDEVRKAVAIINQLPRMSELDPNDFPTRGYRLNHRAQALGLTDLKSTALQKLLHFLGLEDPTQWAYAPRNATIDNGIVFDYFMEVKNFDPINLIASPYINNTLYTVQRIGCPDVIPTQPFEQRFASTMPVAARANGDPVVNIGTYITGLTRDDVGGLRYLYHQKNYNFEPGFPSLALQTNGIGGFSASGNNFRITQSTSTNLFGSGGIYDSAVTLTNATSIGSVGLGPFDSAVTLTNATTTGAGGVGGVGGVGNALAQPVVAANAVRPGIDQIVLEETNYDSLLGEFFTPLNISYTETIVTNGFAIKQNVVRNITAPDLVFDAKDLQAAFGQTPLAFTYVTTSHNMTFINGDTVDSDPGDDWGPGLIQNGSITFNTVRLMPEAIGFLDPVEPFFGQNNGVFPNSIGVIWAAFDGSTDAPVVFPQGIDFEEIESLVLSR
jgi:hypothetical protein